jgi:protein required for attachment to host cells
MAHQILTLVADADHVHVFRRRDGDPRPVPAPEIAVAMPARREFSDRPGRVQDSGGQGRHAMDGPSVHEIHLDAVARAICHGLEPHVGNEDRLVVIAPPALLGRIRRMLPDRIDVAAEHALEIANLSGAALLARVQAL